MVRLLGLVWLVLMAVGCAEDVTTRIAVGPSASSRYGLVQDAVDAINEEIGEDVFELIAITGDRPSHDWAPVVIVDELADGVGAEVRHSDDGLQICITTRTNVVQLAHEFGHAAGLEHTRSYDNLMFRSATKLGLNQAQRKYLRQMREP
jgi:hypothetical protein